MIVEACTTLRHIREMYRASFKLPVMAQPLSDSSSSPGHTKLYICFLDPAGHILLYLKLHSK